jgi:transposase
VWHSARVSGSPQHRPSYDELAALVGEQAAVITELQSEVTELRSEVAELRRRLGMDSSNSSKPPSSDGLDRAKRSSSGSAGKRGKPRGAPGATKMLVDDPDETVACRPAACGNCARDLGGASVFASQRRQVFEVLPPPKPHVTEYQVESLTCPGCGAVTCGDAPAGVSGRVQYGPGAKARMAYLRGAQFLPFGRAAHALDVLCGLAVAPGTVLAARPQRRGSGTRRDRPRARRRKLAPHLTELLTVWNQHRPAQPIITGRVPTGHRHRATSQPKIITPSSRNPLVTLA